MSTIASLRILLGLDATDVSRGAGRVKGELKGVQVEANRSRDALKGVMAGFGLGAGLGAFNLASRAAQEFTAFVGDSITKASALNETLSKSSIIFGQDAKAVEAWGRTAATAFGQSTGQAIEARATLGNLFKTMGLGRADVLGMSQNVVELASDLASFNNIPVDEVLTKLRSGLVGESLPLRVLGVNLTEATVKAKAMALGLADANGALSESAKVQARYALILEQTGTAQGDFGRTSEGLANQQKILAANIADLSTEFGALVVGPLTSLVKILNDDVIPGLRTAGELIGDVGQAAADAAGPVADFVDALTPEAGFRWQDLFAPENRPKGIPELAREFAELAGLITDTGLAAQDFASTQGPVAGALSNTAGATTALTGDTVALTAATKAGAAAMLTEREATLAAAAAVAELKKFTDAIGDSAAEAGNNLLDFASGANTAANDAIEAATAAKELQAELSRIERNIRINIDYKIATAPFINPRAAPGTADANRQNAFDSGGDADALDQANRNFLTRDRLAKDAAAREQAAREKGASDARSAREKAAREAERAGAEKAADAARRHADMLADQFDAAKDKARDYFDVLHEGNQRAIDDIRDRANEELTAQQKAIRGVVSAEQARINAVRAREQENSLRGAVTDAETPEDRTSAQRDLNRFLEDQRLGRMSANADIAVALIDQEKAKNDALAAEATKAENTRAADQRAAFDDEIAALQKNLSRQPEEWAKAQAAIRKLLKDSIPAFFKAGQDEANALIAGVASVVPSVTATSPNASAPTAGLGSAATTTFTLVQHIYIDGVLDRVERGQATLQSVYNPAPPSASGRV